MRKGERISKVNMFLKISKKKIVVKSKYKALHFLQHCGRNCNLKIIMVLLYIPVE